MQKVRFPICKKYRGKVKSQECSLLLCSVILFSKISANEIIFVLEVNASRTILVTILVTICIEGYFKGYLLFGDYFRDYIIQSGNYFLKI